MPWRCPACTTVIRKRETVETVPRLGVVYHCPACHLELAVDEKTGKLKIAPLPRDTIKGRRVQSTANTTTQGVRLHATRGGSTKRRGDENR